MINKVNAISLVIAMVILSVIIHVISCMVEIEASPQSTHETFPYQLSIHGGEYVWHVARRCATPDKDIREIVWEIEKASGLSSAGNVKAGQWLRVPMYCIEQLTTIGVVE